MKPDIRHNSTVGSQEPGAEHCLRVSSAKPTFTRPSAGESRRYVASKSKTNPGMLHQSRALKAPAADKARDRSETGGGSGASRTLAGNLVEVSGAAQAAPVTPSARGMESLLAVRPARQVGCSYSGSAISR